MATSASVSEDSIQLNVVWNGYIQTNGGASEGGKEVTLLTLLFRGVRYDIELNLPQLAGRVELHEVSTLELKVDQVRALMLKAAFLTPGQSTGPMIMDRATGVRSQFTTFSRYDKGVEFGVPSDMEVGKTYTLLVTSSENLCLSAHFSKGTKEEALEQYNARKAKIEKSLKGPDHKCCWLQ